ncbi:unnamed protein product, partial [Rotaria sp. Silwood1]
MIELNYSSLYSISVFLVGVPTLTYSCSIPTKKNNNSSGNIKEHPQSDVSQIKFKIELAKRFRARYLTDYEPKNAYKRD